MICQPLISQTGKIKSGNRHYYRYNYSRAIKYYEPVKEKSIEILRNLGDSYMMTGDYGKARGAYEQIISQPQKTFEDAWTYYLILQHLGEYDKAHSYLDILSGINPEDSRVEMHKDAGTYYQDLLKEKPRYEVKNLKMNSRQQDFSPAYYGEQVVYASTRNHAGIVRRTWTGNSLQYLNLYISETDNNKEIKRGKPFNKQMNRKYHDGPVSFNAAGNVMVITRNNYQSKSSDGTRNLQIFISELVKGRWSEPISFPYNNAEYSVGQACLTPDGSYMYFVSDMPGGKGGTDLYKIERRNDGTWGELQNLKDINTEGNEMFPVYHTDGLLYFSSNGHPGLGGLDVFVSPISGDNYGTPKNMGLPVNTQWDDFSLILDKKHEFGYLSSDRIEGRGSDDIYTVKVLEPMKFEKRIRGVTKDKEDNIIAGAEVILTLEGKQAGKTVSDGQGKYEFLVNQEALYHLRGIKAGYTDGENTANTDVPQEIVYADLILEKTPDFALRVVILDRKTEQPIMGAKLTLKNNNTFEEEVVYTNAKGIYYKELPNMKLNDKMSYNLVIEKQGYVTNTVTYYQLLDKPGEYELIEKLDPLTQDLIVGDDLGKKFQINPIYFDFDKHNIRPDAAIELNKIIQIMNEYPTMVIELGSHTDCRGSYAYNIALSDRRAKSSAEYVRDRITNPERIYGKGYGESKLVNNCECENDRIVPCSEEEHQLNRRTEFVIVGYDDKYKTVKEQGRFYNKSGSDDSGGMNIEDTEPGWYIIGGSFKNLKSAEQLLNEMKSEGYSNARIVPDEEKINFRVAYEKFDDKDLAEAEIGKLKAKVKNGSDIWLLKQ